MLTRLGLLALLLLVAGGCASDDPAPSETVPEQQDMVTPPAECGNDLREGAESCDGDCPDECAPRTCRVAALTGTPESCDVQCSYEPVTECVSGDGCCGSGCTLASDDDCTGVRLDARYSDDYQLLDLGSPPGIPSRLGGAVFSATDPDLLLVGGSANTAGGKLYAIRVLRDPAGHVIGFDGTGAVAIDAPYNDGGMAYGPDGTLFLAQWPVNRLGQTRAGGTTNDAAVLLTSLGVPSSISGLATVPAGLAGAGSLKIVTYGGGSWFSLGLSPTGTGTFDVATATAGPVLSGGPEGIVYVPTGSPQFSGPALLLSEYSAGVVSTYDVDGASDPLADSRKLFVIGLSGAEGATIDPTSGDFVFTTFGGGDRIIVVHGFNPID